MEWELLALSFTLKKVKGGRQEGKGEGSHQDDCEMLEKYEKKNTWVGKSKFPVVHNKWYNDEWIIMQAQTLFHIITAVYHFAHPCSSLMQEVFALGTLKSKWASAVRLLGSHILASKFANSGSGISTPFPLLPIRKWAHPLALLILSSPLPPSPSQFSKLHFYWWHTIFWKAHILSNLTVPQTEIDKSTLQKRSEGEYSGVHSC